MRQRESAHGGDADVRTFGLTLQAGQLVPPQTPEWHQLIYAVEGSVTVRARDVSWVVPPHRAVWLPAGTSYQLDLLGQVGLRTLYIAQKIFPAARVRPCNVNVSPLLRQLILHAVDKGALKNSVPAERHAIGLILDQLEFVEAVPLQLPEPKDPRAQKLAKLLQAHRGDSRTLPELAKLCGASVRTLERVFRAEVGMTLAQWRKRLQMIDAIRRLAKDASVTEVALDSGYESVSAFIAAFRSELGTTPGRWLARQ